MLGSQGAGVVVAVGVNVRNFKAGDRIASICPGAYSAKRNVPADRVLHLPADISEDVAAAMLLRGLTAEYLLRRLYKVKAGDEVLAHSAAGGMGLILILSARVIGTVGSDSKVGIARAHGCDGVIVYTREDFASRIMDLTDNAGVDVIYDGVGKAAFLKSPDCIRPMGMVDQLRNRLRNVEAFDLQLLHRKSIIVTRPTLRTWIARRSDYEAAAAVSFEALTSGKIP